MANLITEYSVQIRDVWNDNLDEEFAIIRSIVDDFNYVAMDTEFPGHVHKRDWNLKTFPEGSYSYLNVNVNCTKLIQLGLTFFNEEGNLPTCGTDHKYCVWQFNFREFDEDKDLHAADSIQLLKNNGIKFNEFKEKGVDVHRFGEQLMTSGIVMRDCLRDVHWIVFHGWFDFGYLLKLLTCRDLPAKRKDFFQLMRIFFPKVYDIRQMTESFNLRAGLDAVARQFKVPRIGVSHHAGSDSLLTCRIFMKLKETRSPHWIESFVGKLFEL